MLHIRLRAAIAAILVAEIATACAWENVTKTSVQEIPVADAVRKINDAAKWAQLPTSLVPLEPAAHQTSSPMETDTSVILAFRAPLADIDAYLAAMHAQKSYTVVYPKNGCPPLPGGETLVREPPPPSPEVWSDSGIFARCTAVAQWEMFSAEWNTRGTTVGTLYRPSDIRRGATETVNVLFTLSGHNL